MEYYATKRWYTTTHTDESHKHVGQSSNKRMHTVWFHWHEIQKQAVVSQDSDYLWGRSGWILGGSLLGILSTSNILPPDLDQSFSSTINILDHVILCHKGLFCTLQDVISIPGLYPLDTSRTHNAVTKKNVSKHCQMSLKGGDKTAPCWESLS